VVGILRGMNFWWGVSRLYPSILIDWIQSIPDFRVFNAVPASGARERTSRLTFLSAVYWKKARSTSTRWSSSFDSGAQRWCRVWWVFIFAPEFWCFASAHAFDLDWEERKKDSAFFKFEFGDGNYFEFGDGAYFRRRALVLLLSRLSSQFMLLI